MRLLGLRLDDHDSNMCLYDHGKVSYFKSERLYQQKHHAYNNQWEWKEDVNRVFGIDPTTIDEIAIIADPLRYGVGNSKEFDYKPYSKLLDVKCPVWHLDHHLAHAHSAWMLPQTKYQFVVDGVGEVYQQFNNFGGAVWSIYKDKNLVNNNISSFYIRTSTNMTVTNSLGVEYENLARYCDIQSDHPNDLAGKLMSLQSYGNIDYNYIDNIKSKIDLKTTLSNYCHPQHWLDYKSTNIGSLTKLDFAATMHELLGQILLDLIKQYADPNDSILLSGGIAQNICWNTSIKQQFPNLVVAPHSADDGLSLGAIEWLRLKNNLQPISKPNFPYWQQDETPLEEPTADTINITAQLLADGKIVGWYQGHGEIGPRALGNRSILTNPLDEDAKQKINSKVKHREEYRPFGATVLKEHQADYFELDIDNPYMLYLDNVTQHAPAITHIDGTCRYQTLGDENKIYRQLLEAFYKITGIPLLLNTSLNRGGKPIAGSKRDALGVLYDTDLDVLVYGNEIIFK